jgi:hypothetical protein
MMLAEYDTIHEAMSLLWSIIEQVDGDLHQRVLSAITYLREQAYESLPWPADADSSYGRLL